MEQEKFRNSQLLIEKFKEELEQAMVSLVNNDSLLTRINASLESTYKEEEKFWKQRSRQLWMCLGDKNTGYFHAVTRGRKAVNKFSVIEDDNGKAFYEEQQIAAVVSAYFQNMFVSPSGDRSGMEEIVFDALSPCISEETNLQLIDEPSSEEIRKAVFSIHPGKAPGPDGFSACFFQSNWAAIGPAIVGEIQEFFSNRVMPRNLNETHIRLIPKGQGPRRVADYRPIALCNVYYKTISKLLAKRLQPLLSSLIAENQSAFVPGRAIADNVLITHEVLHFLKTSGARKHVSTAVKTDMSKAYDRVEWSFVHMVFQRLGFHPIWTNWIIQCISTVSYSFLINDTPQRLVVPVRGIRQGDPLSPYIFILCSEVFSGLCRKAQASGQLYGIRVARGCPRVNHLLFADDTMFFCKASEKSCRNLKKILEKYEAASGQRINASKSSISFSRLASEPQRSKAKHVLGISQEGGVGKYLGLPEHFGRKKKDLFSGIVDKIRQKSVAWSSKFLSTAGKLTMLKSVLAAMPSYAMSCFQLPVSLCKRIQSTLTRFWWDSKADKKGICWVSWEKLTKSKQDGGLGFRDLQCFNAALLGKLSWRILNNPSCFLARVLLGKYCISSSLLDATCPASASHGWRSILIGRDLLKLKLGWTLGNGQSIQVWKMPWLSTSSLLQPFGPAPLASKDWFVCDLFKQGSLEWDVERIDSLLPAFTNDILSLKPSRLGALDKQVWLGQPNRSYSTKSGYFVAKEASSDFTPHASSNGVQWKPEVWAVPTSPKVKLFLWKALQGALPTSQQLQDRHISVDLACVKCGEPESILHLLFHCPFAQQVWAQAPSKLVFPSINMVCVQSGLLAANQLICLPPSGVS